MSVEILNPGPEWSYRCDAAPVVKFPEQDHGFGRCSCGWQTAVVTRRQFSELLEVCNAHLAVSGDRMTAHVRSLPRVDAEYVAEALTPLLDELRDLADLLDVANRRRTGSGHD